MNEPISHKEEALELRQPYLISLATNQFLKLSFLLVVFIWKEVFSLNLNKFPVTLKRDFGICGSHGSRKAGWCGLVTHAAACGPQEDDTEFCTVEYFKGMCFDYHRFEKAGSGENKQVTFPKRLVKLVPASHGVCVPSEGCRFI